MTQSNLGSLVERVEFVGLVVAVVPPLVVVVDVLAAVGSVLAADHEDQRREHGSSGDSDVQADAEVVAGPFHHVASLRSTIDNQFNASIDRMAATYETLAGTSETRLK